MIAERQSKGRFPVVTDLLKSLDNGMQSEKAKRFRKAGWIPSGPGEE